MPITDLALDPPIVEAILGKRLDGMGSSMQGGGANWQAEIDYRLATFEACKKIDFDAVVALSDYSLTTKAYRPKYIDQKRYVDCWGRIMEENEKSKTTYFVGGVVSSPEDLDRYEPPDAFHPDAVEMIQKIIRKVGGQDIVIMAQCHSAWHMAFQVRGGVDKLCIDFYKNPGFAHRMFDKIAKACQRVAESLIENGAEVLFVTDDYADSKAPMMNPRLFREYELPRLKQIVDIAKKHGVPVIKHSDGNLYPILDDIIGTGITALHPIEPGAMDLKDVKDRYGRKVCVAGNVDCRYVLPFGDEAAVRRDVRRCIDQAAEGGGYILTSSSSIHADVKPANVLTMVDEARRYGKYPLRKAAA